MSAFPDGRVQTRLTAKSQVQTLMGYGGETQSMAGFQDADPRAER